MKKLAFLLVLILCVTNLIGCALAETGRGFSITMEADPGTGYDWVATFDDETIAHIEGSYVEIGENVTIMDIAGYYDYMLIGDKEGEGLLTMSYMRPGDESSVKTSQLFMFYVDADLNVTIDAYGTLFR